MIVHCAGCGERYDDAENSTICPHRPIMRRTDMERKKLALELLGKPLRFAHMKEIVHVESISWNGMVTIRGMSGAFAPHLFVIVEGTQEDAKR